MLARGWPTSSTPPGWATSLCFLRAAVAAVIAAEDLDTLIEAAEDLADIRAAQQARDEIAGGAEQIPWEQVKADLGLA
jgi:hypothetical protein